MEKKNFKEFDLNEAKAGKQTDKCRCEWGDRNREKSIW